MAEGAMRVLGSSVGLGVTGVAGPTEQDDVPVGTVFVAVAIAGAETTTRQLRLPGQRDQIRQFAVINALDLLRRQLVLRAGAT
jgi:nicotinamide-nucleotide amidase